MARSTETKDLGTVLVVDDDSDILIVLKVILERHGYRTLLAADAEDALQLLERADLGVDLMLTDLVMPGMSGTDLATKSLMLRPKLPILFMTGFADEEAVHISVWDDTVCLLTKPFTADVLLGKICEVLGEKPFSGPGARDRLNCILRGWSMAGVTSQRAGILTKL